MNYAPKVAGNSQKPCISVVVCTYNRMRYLRECLQSLCDQSASRVSFEVVVVDNNSTDCTESLVREFMQTVDFSLRYVQEPKQGLSHARNRALQEVRAELVGFVDDDVRLSPDWVTVALQTFNKNSDAQIVCGPYFRFCLERIPVWFPEEYGTWVLGAETSRAMRLPEYINGGNMVFRKSSLKELGGFSTELGMDGEKIAYGEETRVSWQAYARNWLQLYVPQLEVSHAVQPYKLSLRWLLRSAFFSGRSNPDIFDRQVKPLHCALRMPEILFRDMFLKALPKGGPLKRVLFYSLRGIFFQLGVIQRMFELHFSVSNISDSQKSSL